MLEVAGCRLKAEGYRVRFGSGIVETKKIDGGQLGVS